MHRSVDGLTDDEFWWEPVPGSWATNRDGSPPLAEARAVDDPTNPPFTTISWRIVHMTLGPWNWINNLDGALLVTRAGRRAFVEDDHVVFRPEPSIPTSALAAVELWDSVVGRLRDTTAAHDDNSLTQQITFPYDGELTAAWIVSHVLRELIHHGAEVGCVRDLYRHTGGSSERIAVPSPRTARAPASPARPTT